MDDFEKILPKVWEKELEIMNVVHNVCCENNIRYSLAYGTLLGAVRHKGYIPWDDDLDICMPREDYNRFLSIWNDSNPEGLVLVNDKNSDFAQNFSKIISDNTTYLQSEKNREYKFHKGIFIDIFPMDYVSDKKAKRFLQKAYATIKIIYTRGYTPRNGNIVTSVLSKIAFAFVPKRKYKDIAFKYENKMISLGNKGNRLVSFSTINEISRIYPKEIFDNLVDMEFQGNVFKASDMWDEILKIRYGDYMKLPPKEEQVLKHHPILIDLEHNLEDIQEN